MKKHILSLVPAVFTAAVLSLASCGGSADKNGPDSATNADCTVVAEKPKFEDVCKDPNAVSVTIKGYKFGMSGDFAAELANYEVKQSTWHMVNDSVAEMHLKNYTAAELVGDRKDNQIDINVEFRGLKGKKIEAGTYMTGSGKDLWVQTTMMTSKGQVWFNWLSGMPEVGSVKLNYVGDDKACGVFTLASEKPDNEQIGTVRLNGNFSVGN